MLKYDARMCFCEVPTQLVLHVLPLVISFLVCANEGVSWFNTCCFDVARGTQLKDWV